MKKFVFIGGLLLFTIFFCCACDGDVTRALRHEGFAYGSEFVCDPFFPKDKEDTSYEKVKYLTGTHIINQQGKIYEVSLTQQYANQSNCRAVDTNIEVVAIFDNKIVKSTDGKLYYLYTDSNKGNAYAEVTAADNSYQLYELLLAPEGTVKVQTVDSSSGLYYVLRNDGNIYGFTVAKADRNAPLSIAGTSVVYNKNNYSGDIIDFLYSGNSSSTFVMTTDKAYKMSAENIDECSKFVDIACKYQMKEFSAYTEYRDYFVAYNGTTVITTYGRIFNVGK